MVSDDAAHAALEDTHPATGASRVGPSGRGGCCVAASTIVFDRGFVFVVE